MLSGVDPRDLRFLSNLHRAQRRQEKAQTQVSSGLKLAVPSDSPDTISNLLQARAELGRTTQIRTNLTRVTTEVNSAEQSISHGISLMDRARSLASQGFTDTASADSRTTLGNEVEALLEQMVGVSNTAVGGRYVFSGDADQTIPFQLDLTQVSGVSLYAGSAATRQIQHPSGSLFSVSRSGDEIFNNADPDKNVFLSLNNLRIALQNNDSDGIEAAMLQVQNASGFLNQQLAYYGKVQNQISEASDYASSAELRLKTQVSDIEEADMTEAISDLELAKFQVDTSMKVKAAIPRTSLFDVLFR